MRIKRHKDLVKRNNFFLSNIYQRLLKVLVYFSLSDTQSYFYEKSQYNLIRSSFKTRIRRFCIISGRARSVYRLFKISRICLKNLGGELFFGLKKASW